MEPMSEESEEHSAAYHALCKKVAQVTKIISFLVARNEDVEHEKQWLDQHFQSVVGKFEIERDELMRQLREGPMRASDTGEGSGIDATTMIQTLSKQHETDKKQAIGEFNNFKETVREREKMLVQKFEMRLQTMTGHVTDMKREFDERVQAFAEITKKLTEDKGKIMERMRAEQQDEMNSALTGSSRRLNDALSDAAKKEEQLRAGLKAEYEGVIEQLRRSSEDRVLNVRQEETIKARSNMETIRRELGAEIDRYRLTESSLRHTITELQQRSADLEITLARKERELHDVEKRKQEEMDMEYQAAKYKIDSLDREIARLKESSLKELEEQSVRLMEENANRLRDTEVKYLHQMNEQARSSDERIIKQEKLIKSQMNELFLKLQSDFSEKQRSDNERFSEKEAQYKNQEKELLKEMDSQRQNFLEREKRLDADYNLKLKEALVNLRETEGEVGRLRTNVEDLDKQNKGLSTSLQETRKSFLREAETKQRDWDAMERSFRTNIAELEKNLAVLMNADKRCEELESAVKVLETRNSDTVTAFQNDIERIKHVNKRELQQLEAALERQEQLSEASLATQAEEFKKRVEIMEDERQKVTKELVAKFDKMSTNKDAQAEQRRLRELKECDMDFRRKLEQLSKQLRNERDEKVREMTAAHQDEVLRHTKTVETLKTAMAQKELDIGIKVDEVSQLSRNMERLKAEFLEKIQDEEKRHRSILEQVSHDLRSEKDEYIHKANAMMRESQDQFERANAAIVAKLKEMEYRWITRDARPEDQERISHLEKEVHEKEFLCRRIMEEMKFFKLELQTREQKAQGVKASEAPKASGPAGAYATSNAPSKKRS
jgi:hypothetical protein